MLIPWHSLEASTLTAILEDFASRDGTDYGEVELSLASKVSQLRLALQQGKLVLFWSEHKQEISLLEPDKL
ncbi:YheU family protein [Balneatrix alpica]|uniref:YheU family protein n=1 Tax=Balneatrix alpica TaxID=75684 RepID=A0ABV5ZDZ5_9GAMM|nr:YheU family protein [Balneatrix alpica]